jgi:DNA-binding MarR family transcriptional regulator
MGHRLITRLTLLLESIEEMELTPIRCLILAHIGRTSGIGVHASRLSRELSVPRATLRYHLETLRHKGLIRRVGPGPHDQRRRYHVLTASGARTLDRAAELLVELTAGGDWPSGAPRRNHWNLRRIALDSPLSGHIGGDPYPGVSTRTPPPGPV